GRGTPCSRAAAKPRRQRKQACHCVPPAGADCCAGGFPDQGEVMHVNAFWVISQLVLGCAVLGLALLLLGALRGLKRWAWRLEQLGAALPGRRGLPPGATAPRFSLPSVQGVRVALKSFAGRRVLLVFTRSDGHPWPQLLPELNRLQ